MARHRRMLAPINTNKHFIARTNLSVASGAIANVVIADAVVAPAATNTFDVVEGAVIKAVHIELWISQSGLTNTSAQCTIIVEKVPSNQAPVTFAQIANLQSYPNKKNILFTYQGVSAAQLDGSNAVSPIRDWLLIPKGKQRFGFGDRLIISIAAIGQPFQTCGMFLYKEYR